MAPAAVSSSQWWDAAYARDDHRYGHRPNSFLQGSERLLRPGSRVLVQGDGEGRNGLWLAGRGHRVTTVDFSSVAVERARRAAEEQGLELDAQVADLADWVRSPQAAGPWDAIVSIWVHLPSAVRGRVSAALARTMAPNGVLVLEAFGPDQVRFDSGGPDDLDLLPDADQIIAEWAPLRVEARTLERRIFEGRGHQGRASVVQALGHGSGART